MNKRDRAILIGLVWGDGYIRTQKNRNGNYSFALAIEHSQKQQEYLEHKADLLTSILGGKYPTIYKRSRLDLRTNKVYHQCSFVKGHKLFRLFRKRMYTDRKKVIKLSWLKHIDAHTLALLYMDDGYNKLRRNKEGKITSCQTYLGLYCPREEAEIMQSFLLNTYDIGSSIHERKNGQCTICMNTMDSHLFIFLVEPFIHISMAYKLNHVIDVSKSAELPEHRDDDIV